MKIGTAPAFSILDNGLLESSMVSTQGLLSFMTDASQQIKTYLCENEQQKHQRKQQRQKRLLQQLTKLNSYENDFIPEITKTSSCNTTPASPTTSLGSDGSTDDDIERPSCLMSRKRKHAPTHQYFTKKTRFEQSYNYPYQYQSNLLQQPCSIQPTRRINDVSNYDCIDSVVPSPSPDFEDLVVFLTDDFIAPIDLNSYFKPNV